MVAKFANVTRLPVKPKRPPGPYCHRCNRDLPTFYGATIDLPAEGLGGARLLAVTYHVECVCGTQVDIRREIRQT